jgi:hypothetical protein
LEFFNKKLEKNQMLNTYSIERDYLKYYLSTVNYHYIYSLYNYVEKLNKSMNIKRIFFKNEGKMDIQTYVKH